jgi:hypothetical protein
MQHELSSHSVIARLVPAIPFIGASRPPHRDRLDNKPGDDKPAATALFLSPDPSKPLKHWREVWDSAQVFVDKIEIGTQKMDIRLGARACAFVIGFVLATCSARAAVFDENDTSRLAGINEAIQSFENDVGSALHNLSSDDAEQIESYAYVELNLQAAHERLNNVFMLVAVSMYMETPSDQFLVLDVLQRQILPPSKNFLHEKKDAIASMAIAHPSNRVFADYSSRADALLGGRAIRFLDELYERIGALRR